jgi:hypothetical protein
MPMPIDGMSFANQHPMAGYYAPLRQTVHVTCIDSRDYEAWERTRDSEGARKFLPVILHELTHWLDHTSTVWGQANLVKVFDALNVAVLHKTGKVKESEFWRIMALHDATRRDRYADYFSTWNPRAERYRGDNPWKIEITCGQAFTKDGHIDSEHPIVFIRFDDHHTNEFVARTPLSVASLLETTATAAQVESLISLTEMDPEDTRLVQRSLNKKSLLGMAYESELTLYSAPVHLLSTRLNISNLHMAYSLSGRLANVCLNLTKDGFLLLRKIQDEVVDAQRRFRAMATGSNRGFAFLALCEAAPPVSGKFNIDEWIDETLENAGLGSHVEMTSRALEEMRDVRRGAFVGPLNGRLEMLLNSGDQNFVVRGLSGSRPLSLDSATAVPEAFRLPPVILSDDKLLSFGNNRIEPDEYGLRQAFDAEESCGRFLSDFIKGCIGEPITV